MFKINGQEKDLRTFSKVSVVMNKRKYICLQLPFCTATTKFLSELENGNIEVEDDYIKFSCYGTYRYHANPRNLKCNVWYFFDECQIENKQSIEFDTNFDGFPCDVIAIRKKKTDDGQADTTTYIDLFGTDIKGFFEKDFGYDEKRYYFDFCLQDSGEENLQLSLKDFNKPPKKIKAKKLKPTYNNGLMLGEPLPDHTQYYQYFIIDFDSEKAYLRVPVDTALKEQYKTAKTFQFPLLGYDIINLTFKDERDWDGRLMGKMGYVRGVTLLFFEGKIKFNPIGEIAYDLTPTTERNKRYREQAKILGTCGKFEVVERYSALAKNLRL